MTGLSLPPRRSEPRSPRLSWAAFLTPVLMAGTLWLLTRSPYALAFAALGPVGALVSVWDGRRGGRREHRAARAERVAELEHLRRRVEQEQEAERRGLLRRTPGAGPALDGTAALWVADGPPLVRIGLGTLRSRAAVSGDARETAELELQALAERLDGAPVCADPLGGIAVCGPPLLARALLRGLAVQLCAALPPGAVARPAVADSTADAEEWDWLTRLPHPEASGPVPRFGVFDTAGEVPPGYRSVLTVTAPGVAGVELFAGEGLLEPAVAPELVSRARAAAFAEGLARRARRFGIGTAARSAPRRLAFADLPVSAGPGLRAAIGRSADGVCEIDLVADGPHAVVAGVTGSGKSELLVTWVAAMTVGRSPAEVSVLLVDFKGGTAFGPLAALPHTVGVITDLGHGEAQRALASLSAELRRREAVLAGLGVRDVAEAGAALPRLVVVVDEFAAMIDAFPEFGALFTDIAARGRALGVHLILCTQRPAGVMRDALVANCPLRLSLRVQSAADSRWVVDTDAASRLPSDIPGRCIVVAAGRHHEVQVARTMPSDLAALLDAAASRPQATGAPVRPWLDPLPAVLGAAELPAGGGPGAVGLADLPERQRREVVRFTPAGDAPLLVLGAGRTGKTGALATLAAAAGLPRLVAGPTPAEAWDVVAEALDHLETGTAGAGLLLVVDDADALIARMPDDYAIAWAERLGRILRQGPAAGVHTVLSAQRLVGALRGVAALAAGTVLLRQASRQDHLLAGGPADLYDETLPPGGGFWRGRRMQFLAPPPTAVPAPVGARAEPHAVVRLPLVPPPGGATVLVGRSSGRLIARALAAGLPADAVVDVGAPRGFDAPSPLDAVTRPGGRTGVLVAGTPEAWLANPGLLQTLRQRHPLAVIGCDASELRALTRDRSLPPLLPAGRSDAVGWLLEPDGTIRRCAVTDAA